MRSVTALSAGMTRMNYLRFLFYELVAASLWNTVFSFLGYFIAGEIEQLQLVIERVGWVLLGIFLLVFLLWRLYRRRRRELFQPLRASKEQRCSVGLPQALL
jgi:membrane-associated protein